jgi:hypothetical protein
MHIQTGRVRMACLGHSILVFSLLTDDAGRDDTAKAGGVRVKKTLPLPLNIRFLNPEPKSSITFAILTTNSPFSTFSTLRISALSSLVIEIAER